MPTGAVGRGVMRVMIGVFCALSLFFMLYFYNFSLTLVHMKIYLIKHENSKEILIMEDFDKINNVQMKNEDKKVLADVVVNTDKSRNLLKAELINIIKGLETAYDQRNCI